MVRVDASDVDCLIEVSHGASTLAYKEIADKLELSYMLDLLCTGIDTSQDDCGEPWLHNASELHEAVVPEVGIGIHGTKWFGDHED